jgi:hypothetical protein
MDQLTAQQQLLLPGPSEAALCVGGRYGGSSSIQLSYNRNIKKLFVRQQPQQILRKYFALRF